MGNHRLQKMPLDQYVVLHIDRALENGWIVPYFQPIIRTITGRFSGAETLARWLDPEYGYITPDGFVPALEKAGLIYKVDCFILTEAVKLQRKRLDVGLSVGPLTVNISRRDIDQIDVAAFVRDALRQYAVPKELICLEITESALVQDKGRMTAVVEGLRAAGFQVWMDDFGSGYSSLSFLNDYTLDVIKLDMGFLKSFTETSREIMRSTVNMAKKLGIRTLAEGVETEAHVRFLREIGCDMMQGYYFSEPLCGQDMERYLRGLRVPAETIRWKRFYDKADACVRYSDAPLAVMEYQTDGQRCRYLFLNDRQREQLRSIGRSYQSESEFILNSASNPLHAKFRELVQQAIATGETVTMYVAENSFYVRYQMHVEAAQDSRYILTGSIVNVTKDRTQSIGDVLNKSISEIVLLFDDVHVLDPKKNTADNLINNFGINEGFRDQDDLRAGIRHFCDHMVYEEDRKRYLSFSDPDTMAERILTAPKGILRDYFRVKLPEPFGGKQYVWKEFNLLRIPDEEGTGTRILSCIKDADATSDQSDIVRALGKEFGGI